MQAERQPVSRLSPCHSFSSFCAERQPQRLAKCRGLEDSLLTRANDLHAVFVCVNLEATTKQLTLLADGDALLQRVKQACVVVRVIRARLAKELCAAFHRFPLPLGGCCGRAQGVLCHQPFSVFSHWFSRPPKAYSS